MPSLEELILAFLPEPSRDFTVSCEGSIYIVTPLTPCANEWVSEFLPEDAMRWAGGVVVEWRYISTVIEGARESGLAVEVQP